MSEQNNMNASSVSITEIDPVDPVESRDANVQETTDASAQESTDANIQETTESVELTVSETTESTISEPVEPSVSEPTELSVADTSVSETSFVDIVEEPTDTIDVTVLDTSVAETTIVEPTLPPVFMNPLLNTKPNVVCTVAGEADWQSLQEFYSTLRTFEPDVPILITCDESILVNISLAGWQNVAWNLSAGIVLKNIAAKTDALTQGIMGYGDALFCDCATTFSRNLPIIDKRMETCLAMMDTEANSHYIWTSSHKYIDMLNRLAVIYGKVNHIDGSVNENALDDHAIVGQSMQYFSVNVFEHANFFNWANSENIVNEPTVSHDTAAITETVIDETASTQLVEEPL